MNQNAPIISSLLETDLYKLTMWQAMLHASPAAFGRYKFICRSKPEFALSSIVDEVNEQLDYLCTLRFTEEELAWLSKKPYFKPDFIEMLRLFQYQRRYIRVSARGDDLAIEASGPLIHVTGFEIPVLAIVNECYFSALGGVEGAKEEGEARLQRKILLIQEGLEEIGRLSNPFKFFDFGLRRRYSGAWQNRVTLAMKDAFPENFGGTSNVLLAKRLGLTAIGTMAHEYLQMYQVVGNTRLKDSQKAALEGWVHEYRGDLGIALTDVIGIDAFLRDFDLYFAKLFDGVRHDSGDPFEWGEKVISHYRDLGIDPQAKRLVFSDGLDPAKALALYGHFGDRIQVGFGIGTNLTNDVGLTPLSIVMKLVSVNGSPVAKLSDSPGKTACEDPEFVRYLTHVFKHAGGSQ